jgi:putative SOS response-associated peptidase YedK
MCGRMTLSRRDLDEVADELEAVYPPELAARYRPRFNVAPTDCHPLLRLRPGDGRRELLPALWGMGQSGPPPSRPVGPTSPGVPPSRPVRPTAPGVPPSRLLGPTAPGTPLLINARAETAPFKPSFREAFARRRCVIPADGFYEWAGQGEQRSPYWLHPPDGGLLRFAGLYAEGPGGELWFTILTTAANAVVGALHDRMPVILPPGAVSAWLREGPTALLQPAAEGTLVATPVSRRVNTVKNDDPGCLLPPSEGSHPQDRQLRLFPL